MIDLFFYGMVFLIGLCIGSFLNCVIWRLHTGEKFLISRSYCPKCRHKLSSLDLIPVLSFIILKGKCRYCRKPISLQYPVIEISTGLIFLLIFNFQFSNLINYNTYTTAVIYVLYSLIIACFLIIIFVYDLKHYIIPDKVIYPAIGIAFFYQIISNFQFPISNFQNFNFLIIILSAILASGFFLAIVLISRGTWMGLGDVKLAFLMGLLLGFPNILVALFLAFLIGAIIGIGLIALSKKTLKSEVPFGPFLVTGTFIAMFWGEKMVSWYLSCI